MPFGKFTMGWFTMQWLGEAIEFLNDKLLNAVIKQSHLFRLTKDRDGSTGLKLGVTALHCVES